MEDIRYTQEKQRLEAILELSNVPKQSREILAPVVDNISWMRIKLDDTRKAIKTASVAVKYDNGGGQTGLRENPLFKGYATLWKSYMQGLEKFTSYLPKDVQEEMISDASVLDIVRGMKNA